MSTRAIRLAAGLAAALHAAGVGAEPPTVSANPPAFEDAMPRGPSVEERLAEIRRRIQAAVRYPPLARWRDASGEALVRFEIDRDGHARDVRVARSAGHPLLDRAAARAVVDAGALPWVYGPLEVPVHFELNGRP